MIFYKDSENKVHAIEDKAFSYLLPNNCTEITADEAYTLSNPAPTNNQIIQDNIRALELSVTPRRAREAALTPEGKAWLADVDSQIEALRKQLV